MIVMLTVSKSLVERYRELLRSDWSGRTVTVAASLIRDQLERSGIRIAFDWEPPKRGGAKFYPIAAQTTKNLAEYLGKLNLELTQVAKPNSKIGSSTHVEIVRLAEVAAALLHLRRDKLLQLDGETGFLRDCQSALYHGCVFFLLPDLKRHKFEEAHARLLNALYAHAMMDWNDSPAQESALKALLYNYLGEDRKNENLLWAAFRGTLDRSRFRDEGPEPVVRDYGSTRIPTGL